MNKPVVTPGMGQITFKFEEEKLRVVAERYDDDGTAVLSFFPDGTGEVLLDRNKVNLLSAQSKSTQARRLQQNRPDIAWDDTLTWITHLLDEARREPLVSIGKRPERMLVEYQVRPILEKGQPTTIYGPGGSAKSYLAAYIACLVQFGVAGLGGQWKPEQGNVIYLDWESSSGDHKRRAWAIKQGLGLDTEDTFQYGFCSQPLVADIHNLQRLVDERKIALVIIDSQMAASGYGPDPSQVSSQYYNALRSLRCTTVTLDHVSKAEWGKLADADSTGPYGSVVKFNRSRSQFEVRKSQSPGANFVELGLYHHKHNEGPLLKEVGIRVEFVNDADGVLEKVTFSPCEVSDNPELSKRLTVKARLISALGGGTMSVKGLAEVTGISEDIIRTNLNRYKDTFVNLGNEWGLRAYES